MKMSPVFLVCVIGGAYYSMLIQAAPGSPSKDIPHGNRNSWSHRVASRFLRNPTSPNQSLNEITQRTDSQETIGESPKTNSNDFSGTPDLNEVPKGSPGRLKSFIAAVRQRRSSRHNNSAARLPDVGDDRCIVPDPQKILEEALSNAKEGLAGILYAANDVFSQERYRSSTTLKGSDEVQGIITVLNHINDILNVHRMKADETFAGSYEETIKANFAGVDNFKPSDVYAYLGYDQKTAMEISHEIINKKIEQLKQEASDDEKKKLLLRQMGYMFRTSATKEIFDAYISKGKEGVVAFQVDPKEAPRFKYLSEVAVELREELVNASKQIQKESASNHQSGDGKIDLADHAFNLEMNVKANDEQPE